MNAAFFLPRLRPTAAASVRAKRTGNRHRARRLHRWVATAFTVAVIANIVAMLRGAPPAWITYAPLPPLFILLATGLPMLVTPWLRAARGYRSAMKVAR